MRLLTYSLIAYNSKVDLSNVEIEAIAEFSGSSSAPGNKTRHIDKNLGKILSISETNTIKGGSTSKIKLFDG